MGPTVSLRSPWETCAAIPASIPTLTNRMYTPCHLLLMEGLSGTAWQRGRAVVASLGLWLRSRSRQRSFDPVDQMKTKKAPAGAGFVQDPAFAIAQACCRENHPPDDFLIPAQPPRWCLVQVAKA